MSEIQKNLISTLITRYKMHPELLDIYVEGKFDKDFLEYIFKKLKIEHSVKVYEISTVDVPNELIASLNKICSGGWLNFKSNKHRVITFAYEMSNKLNKGKFTGLVDTDCDQVLGRKLNIKHLNYTSPTCMEAYFLLPETLENFFSLQCNLDAKKVADFLKIANLILPVIFTMRAVNENEKFNCSVVSYTSGIKKKGDFLSFTAEKYIDSYISKHNLNSKKIALRENFDAIYAALGGDLQHKCHGHDFITLLYDYIEAQGSIKFHGKETNVLEHGNRMLASVVDPAALMASDPFKSIFNPVHTPSF